MKGFVKVIAFVLSLFLCSCTTETIYYNNDDNVVIAVEESDCYQIESPNPQKVKRGSDVRFGLAFNDDYGYKNSSDGTFDNGYLLVENVQYSKTIHIDCAEMVTVFLETYENCHYSVTSENPMTIEKGTDAIFTVEFDEGYVFESSTDGEFENDKFIFRGVETSKTTSLIAKTKGNIHVRVVTDVTLGSVTMNGKPVLDDYGDYDDLVELAATPITGKRFVCWSINGYITSTMPFSFERVFDYRLTNDVTLYANFWDNNTNTIAYFGNGGFTACGDEAIYYPHVKGNHIRLNTIQGSKAFYKEGYQLEAWNTKPDGSGDRIGLGSRVKIPNEDEPLFLYAMWIKETSDDAFEFSDNGDSTFSIAQCSSQDECIVIPERHLGNPITTIKAGAFDHLPFTSLYLPQYLKNVESGAVIDCANFNSIHFFDYLDSILNDFYSGKKPSYLYINANTDPCYMGSYQSAFVRKTDLLLECDDEKYVFVGNSNTMYSIDGSMIRSSFGKDVLCYGVQSGVGVAWELACLRYYCRNDKNIVVFCCEFGSAAVGSFSEHKYYAAEGNYDLLLAIDFNEMPFSNVFGAYSVYKTMKSSSSATPYSKNDYGCDAYGCLKINKEPYRSEDWAASTINVNLSFYTNGGFAWIESYCSSFTKTTFLISSCSFNKNCISENQRIELYSSYEQSIVNHTSYSVISSLADYAFPGSAFDNDNYHLIYSYAVERTNRLIHDLLKA